VKHIAKQSVKKILFVCTGNIFRSVTIELCLKEYLRANNIRGFHVSSAGIIAKKEPMRQALAVSLQTFGIDPQRHIQRKVTAQMLAKSDIVICMTKLQQRFLLERFGKNAQLYFDVLSGSGNDLLDVDDIVPKLHSQRSINSFVQKTVRFIYSQTPNFFRAIKDKYLLFTEFEAGRRLGIDGLPYIQLAASKKSIAFMSQDIPAKHPFHVLVIPKKLYTHLDDIPLDVQADMMDLVRRIAKVSFMEADGYNILVNSGLASGQIIYHAHIHIIPRVYNDGIRIELWKHRRANKKLFVKMNRHLQKSLGKWQLSQRNKK